MFFIKKGSNSKMFAETCMTVLESVRILILSQLVVERIYQHCCESMRLCVCVFVCMCVCVWNSVNKIKERVFIRRSSNLAHMFPMERGCTLLIFKVRVQRSRSFNDYC